MKKITTLIVSAITVLGVGAAVLVPAPVYAATQIDCNKLDSAKDITACSACQTEKGAVWKDAGKDSKCESPSGSLDGTVKTVINAMLFIIGILSVIMIVYGGIRYAISGGASDKVKDAKNTIVYAVVGLVVAILAWAIVNWVIGAL